MAALLKARPPERDPESADLLAMLAVMRELTVELFESELPPAVKALDAASKARSGPELRRAVVKSGEPGHEAMRQPRRKLVERDGAHCIELLQAKGGGAHPSTTHGRDL